MKRTIASLRKPRRVNEASRIDSPHYAGTSKSPHVLNTTIPAAKTPTAEAMLMFPGSFSGAKTSVRKNLQHLTKTSAFMPLIRVLGETEANLENADSLGSTRPLSSWAWCGKYADWDEGAPRRAIFEIIKRKLKELSLHKRRWLRVRNYVMIKLWFYWRRTYFWRLSNLDHFHKHWYQVSSRLIPRYRVVNLKFQYTCCRNISPVIFANVVCLRYLWLTW